MLPFPGSSSTPHVTIYTVSAHAYDHYPDPTYQNCSIVNTVYDIGKRFPRQQFMFPILVAG